MDQHRNAQEPQWIRSLKLGLFPRRYIYHFFPSGFCKPNLYRFKLWLLPTLMGDTVGWAGNELLLWHLLCIGNGAAQQKGTRALPDHLCVPSKPESEAVKSGIARNSRMLKHSFLTLSISWLVTNSGRRLMTPPWTDGWHWLPPWEFCTDADTASDLGICSLRSENTVKSIK